MIQLFTPGPTMIPKEVQAVINETFFHHRSAEFRACYLNIVAMLNQLLGKKTQHIVLSSSGTGAMEACVSSVFQEKDDVLVLVSGKFGERWQALAQCYGLNADCINVQWGQALSMQVLAEHIKKKQYKAVLMQACETSTAVFHPVYDIGQLLKNTDTLLCVDAITATAIYPFDLNKDGIDVLISGSQKALMCPPGLAILSLSEKALQTLPNKSRSYYFSIQKELDSAQKGNSTYTPALPLFFGLQKSLQMILEEGKEQRYQRHKNLQRKTRVFFRSLHFDLFNSDEDAALGLTAVKAREDIAVDAFLDTLKNEHNIWLAGGQAHLKGKIFRFGHMGHCFEKDLDRAFDVIEKVCQSFT